MIKAGALCKANRRKKCVGPANPKRVLSRGKEAGIRVHPGGLSRRAGSASQLTVRKCRDFSG